MKKILTLINFVLLIFVLSCSKNENPTIIYEDVPNKDFEIWVTENEFSKPQHWNTSNFSLFSIVTFNTVTADSVENYSGKYCPRLETKLEYADSQPVKVAGLITLGNFDINIATRTAQVNGGIPFIQRPVFLNGFYKYAGVGIDSCFIDIVLTKHNSQLMKKDTIGQGRFSSSGLIEWNNFTVPINYKSEENPDSLNIIILSSDTSIFESGSTLWIDQLSFSYN